MSKHKESIPQVMPCKSECTKCIICSQIKQLSHSHIGQQINSRILDFHEIDKSNQDELFSEMCFCILTANFSAIRCIEIQKKLGSDIMSLSEKELASRLKELGYRFPNTRANYIFESRKWYNKLFRIMQSYSNDEQKKLRNWIAKNVKGLGLKESSHFLRNIGYNDCGIIDFHIVDLLVSHSIIERPKTLTKRKYEEIESVLGKIAEIQRLTLAELDLYLWFMETGKILK